MKGSGRMNEFGGVSRHLLARLTALAVGLPLALLVSGTCLAATHSIDQQNTAYNDARNEGTETIAQTFTVGMSGTLDQVDLMIWLTDSNQPGSATAIIEAVDGSGDPVYPPVGSPLSTGAHAIPSAAHTWVPFTMTPLAVTAGQHYAIVVTPTTFFTGDFWSGGDEYTRGKGYEGGTYTESYIAGNPNADWVFRTYVTPAPPAMPAAFAAPSMSVGQAVALTFTIANGSGNGPVTGVGFSDTLPTGLTVSSGSASACGVGTLTRTSPSGIALSGGSLADGASCQVSAIVTGSAAGAYTTTTGAVSSTEGGPGNTASASVNVDAYPSIAAAFNPSSVAVGATTALTFTITNPAGNPDVLHFIGLTDTLPAGLTVANAAAVTTCGAGSLTVTAPNSIVLSAASVAVDSPCVFSVPVTAGVAGSYTNTVTATLGGFTYPGNTASAGLGVAAAAPTPTPTPAPTPTPTPTPTPSPTKSPTPPPTSTGVGSAPDNTGGTIWLLPFALVAFFGGLLILVDRRRRRTF